MLNLYFWFIHVFNIYNNKRLKKANIMLFNFDIFKNFLWYFAINSKNIWIELSHNQELFEKEKKNFCQHFKSYLWWLITALLLISTIL